MVVVGVYGFLANQSHNPRASILKCWALLLLRFHPEEKAFLGLLIRGALVELGPLGFSPPLSPLGGASLSQEDAY